MKHILLSYTLSRYVHPVSVRLKKMYNMGELVDEIEIIVIHDCPLTTFLCQLKLGGEAESISFDLRPSDAINIAVRCKVIM